MTTPALTQRLSRLLCESTAADIGPELQHEAKRSLVNWMGAALGGCRDESVLRALATLQEFAGPGAATVVGHDVRTDALTAALVNGISSNILDFDDTHAHIVLHPTASIACALLALSQARRMSGVEFLHALVLGIEIQCRVGNILCTPPAECAVGLSTQGLLGGIGAAVAAAKALGLDEHGVATAIGLAANQAAGIRESQSTMGSHLALPEDRRDSPRFRHGRTEEPGCHLPRRHRPPPACPRNP